MNSSDSSLFEPKRGALWGARLFAHRVVSFHKKNVFSPDPSGYPRDLRSGTIVASTKHILRIQTDQAVWFMDIMDIMVYKIP